jgi:hypothetical protein
MRICRRRSNWPKVERKRQIIKFLWFPKRIKGEWRWFEFAIIEQKWTNTKSHWLNIDWVNN